MSLFTGSGVALVTPFKDGGIDYATLEKLIDFHLASHTDALVIAGTTGESATLSLDEKKELIKYSVSYVNHRCVVIAGTGSNDTKTSVELSVYAESVGVDGLLLVVPYYNKPTQKGLIAHFTEIANHVHIPCMLYNVPSRTGTNLLPETVQVLASHPMITSIKEASGNLEQIKKVIDLCNPSFDVYSGNDDQTIDILRLGGKGVISVTANIIPQTIHEMCELYQQNPSTAKEKADALQALHEVMFIESNPVPAKRALQLMGYDCGLPRLPLVSLEPDHDETLIKILTSYGLIGGEK